MEKISVIIPIYNVEPYLEDCLISILNQTYKSLEIICVNDGSTDNSGEICEIHAKKDKRIKVIHKKNGGVSTALNVGLNELKGDYVSFVDPDDWLEADFYKELLFSFQKHSGDADICICNFNKTYDTKKAPMINRVSIPENIIISKRDAFKFAFVRDDYEGVCAYRWNKLYSSKFFTSHQNRGFNLRFDESIHGWEDVYMFAQCLEKSVGILYTNKHLYNYRQLEVSLSRTQNLSKRVTALDAYEKIIKIIENIDLSSNTINWIKGFHTHHAINIYKLARELGEENLVKTIFNSIPKYSSCYSKCSEKNFKNLISVK